MFTPWRTFSMWQWLSIPTFLLLVSLSVKPCLGAPTSNGPVSQEEAATLWREGEKALEGSRFEDSLNYLLRYVDRYPGSPNYLKANFYLGKTLIELGKPDQALPYLKNYLNGTGNNRDAGQGRLWLGHAYLGLK